VSGKANRRTVRDSGREDPSSRQPNLTVTATVTPKDGHPERPGNKAKSDVLSRPLDFTTQARRLLSVKEAAEYLGISQWTMRGLGWNGEIPEVKIGRRVLFDREDLDAFVERSKR